MYLISLRPNSISITMTVSKVLKWYQINHLVLFQPNSLQCKKGIFFFKSTEISGNFFKKAFNLTELNTLVRMCVCCICEEVGVISVSVQY